MVMNKEKPSSHIKGLLIFLIYSTIGIFAFFVKIRIGGVSKIPADHLIGLLKRGLEPYYVYIALFLIICDIFIQIKKKKNFSLGELIDIMQPFIGGVLVLLFLIDIGNGRINTAVGTSIKATGDILCAIGGSSVFIPFLMEYGLVDAVGVLLTPVMRKLFHTPGSSAVIIAGAFLGNYSMGHIMSSKMYQEGRYSEREALIIALGFSTCSIGLMFNLASYMELMDYWGLYVLDILIITFIITALVSRVFPISRKSSQYVEGGKGEKEDVTGENLILNSFRRAEEVAGNAAPLYAAEKNILIRTFPVIARVTGTSIFIITLGSLLAQNTDIFRYIGMVFLPIIKLFGFTSKEISHILSGIGVSVMEPVLAGVINQGSGLSFLARWIIAVVPYTSVIFFAGFIPSIRSCNFNINIGELLLIWVERMFMGILLAGLSGLIISCAVL